MLFRSNFGAFARIEDGIEGLVHVSELSDLRISHPRQLVHEGQDLLVRIIRIDPQRRRMGLSLRRALEATDEEVEEALGAEAVELKHQLLALEVEPDEDGVPAQRIEREPSPEVEETEESSAPLAAAVVLEDDEEPQTAAGLALSQAFAEAAAADESASNDEGGVSTATDGEPGDSSS